MTDLSELITCLITTSPTASDPSPDAIGETAASFRRFDAHANTRLLVGADGVRPEQRDEMREGWGEPLSQRYAIKLDLASFEMAGHSRTVKAYGPGEVLKLRSWGHQANVLRMLLAEVTTPLVLVLEHDTPLTADVEIDWQTAAECILSRELDSIRFLHESHILPDYQHLMLDSESQYFATMPYIRTAQWSQRPHLAFTNWYRWIIDTYFAPSSRTMVEDVMHGVVTAAWQRESYGRFRLGIYSDPEPTMQRSYHLDGRAGGEKYEMCFAYPGDAWPAGAPAPTLGRKWE